MRNENNEIKKILFGEIDLYKMSENLKGKKIIF